MKYLFITLKVQEGEREHTHHCLHTTKAQNINFAAQRYAASYWGESEPDKWGDKKTGKWSAFGGEITITVENVIELSEPQYNFVFHLFSGATALLNNTEYFPNKPYLIFGKEAVAIINENDMQYHPIQEIIDRGIDFETFHYNGNVADVLQKCMQWGDYAFILEEHFNQLKEANESTEFIMLSPDGFAIHYEDTYPDEEAAETAFSNWLKNFEHQGYYSSPSHGRIPLNQVRDYCRIVPAPQFDDTDDDDDDLPL